MKKYLSYCFFMAAILFTVSCSKDLGNYNYHTINQVTFSNFETVKGYQVLFGDSLKINPNLTLSQDAQGSGSYNYQWSFRLGTSTTTGRDSVISTSKDLKVKISLTPGTYSLQYLVTDNGTGVTFHTRANVIVSSQVFEGYMLLNEVNGQSRLDMLSYNKTADAFTQNTDVLKQMGSTLPMGGKPYQVYCMQYTNANISAQNYGIFVLTSTGCNRIHQETFAYNPSFNIRNLFIGDVPANFAPQRITGELSLAAYPLFYLYDKGNIYSYSTFAGYAFKYNPFNIYVASSPAFSTMPYVASTGTTGAMYNNDKKSFVSIASYSSTVVTDVGTNFNYPTGMEMVFMDKDNSNRAYAILKDPATSKIYMLRFPIGSAQNYYEEILGADIATATNFTVSPDLGYLFYSSGGKVYEYDLSLKTSKLMVDKGASKISFMSFQRFFMRTTSTINPKYATWANYLSVASYDPTGTEGSNGTFELYSIPPVNGQIVKVNGWNGFGKIVSISYRER
jgi:hypothetical protein